MNKKSIDFINAFFVLKCGYVFNKEISELQYNLLNLPSLVDLGDINIIEYLYDAAC